jgi:hypothetical protein
MISIARPMIFLILLFTLGSNAWGQAPNWQAPNPANYTYSATVVARVVLDDSLQSGSGWQMAFFSGGEIRGLSNEVLVGGEYFLFTTVYSHVFQETMSLEVYSAETGWLYASFTPYAFFHGTQTGSVNQAFEVVVYTNDDAPIALLPTPEPFYAVFGGAAFGPIDFTNLLISLDGDPVLWTLEEHPFVEGSFEGGVLTLAYPTGFSGSVTLMVRATEQTNQAFFAETPLTLLMVGSYEGPEWRVIPGQGTVLGSTFENLCDDPQGPQIFNLNDFEQAYTGPCLAFDYLPVVEPQQEPEDRPNWVVTGSYVNGMTLVARVGYTPNYLLNHPQDLLVAFINGEVRGVAGPTQEGEDILYYLTIAGGPGDQEITLYYYSEERRKIYQHPQVELYEPYSQLGSSDAPYAMDFCPLWPHIDEQGNVSMEIKDTLWVGEQSFYFIAYDCDFPQLLSDTTRSSFCVVASAEELTYYYRDSDGDGHGDPLYFTLNCLQPEGYSASGLDCDDTDPLISPSGPIPCCVDISLYLDNSGQVDLTPDLIDDYRWEICGILDSWVSIASFGCESVGPNLVQLSVYDLNENVDQCLSLVTVQDTLAPVFTCPESVALPNCTEGVPDLVALVLDQLAVCGVDTVFQNPPPGVPVGGQQGAGFEVILTVVDVNGNSTACAVEVFIADDVPPYFVSCPQDTLFTMALWPSTCEVGVVWPVPVAADDCLGVVVEQTAGPAQNSLLGVGIYTIEYTAYDVSGNEALCSFVIEVIDTQDPLIVCPGNFVVASNDFGTCEWTSPPGSLRPLLAIGNCDYEVRWSLGGASQGSGLEDVSGWVFPLGITQVTYTIEELASGQLWVCDFTVEVVDRERPLIQCPPPLVLECADPSNQVAIDAWLASATATDNCDAAPLIETTLLFVNSQCGQTETLTYEFRVTDASGNTSFCLSQVVIRDTTPPRLIKEAQPLTVQCDGFNNSLAILHWLNNQGFAEVEETCGAVTWTHNYGNLQADCGASGGVEVTFVARDACGNTTQTTAVFTIIDEQAPIWEIFPVDLTLECDGTSDPFGQIQGWLQTVGGAEAKDDCSLIVYSHDYLGLLGGCSLHTGSALVTFTATDACGNSSSAAARVTVVDTQAPVLMRMARDTVVNCDGMDNPEDLARWLSDHGAARALDLCSGPVTWTHEKIKETQGCGNAKTLRYRFFATDACGNRSADTEADFIIGNMSAPSVTAFPQDLVVECDGAGNEAELSLWLQNNGGGEANDICGTTSWSYVLVRATDFCAMTGIRTYRFTVGDACDNTLAYEASFIIQDTTAPLIEGGEDVVDDECLQSGTGNYPDFDFWLTHQAGAVATDGCGSVTWSNDYHPSHWVEVCGETRYVEVVFTATDACGNSSTLTARYTIGDSQPPVFVNCPRAPIVVHAPQGWCAAFVNFSAPMAEDNCGSVTLRQIDTSGLSSGSLFPVGSTRLIYEARDECGNADTCEYLVVVNDFKLPPDFICPSSVEIVNEEGICGAAAQNIGLRALEDNCPDHVAVLYRVENVFGERTGCGISDASGRIFPVGRHGVVYEVRDQPILLISEVLASSSQNALEITNFGPASYDITGLEIRRFTPDEILHVVPAGTRLLPGEVYVVDFPTLPSGTPQAFSLGYLGRFIDGVALHGFAPPFSWQGSLQGEQFSRRYICDSDGAEDWRATEDCFTASLGILNRELEAYVFPWNGALATLQSMAPLMRECRLEVNVLDTEAPQCNTLVLKEYLGGGAPISGGNCWTSSINVAASFPLSKVRILNLNGEYPSMMDLSIRLVSPAGTEVLLFENICHTTANFQINLADDAAQTLAEVPCGPAGQGGTYQPLEALKVLAGENSQGTWKLELFSSSPLSGQLLGWTLQLEELLPYGQGDVTLSALPGQCGAPYSWVHPYFSDNCCRGQLEVVYSSAQGIPLPTGGVLSGSGGTAVTQFFGVGTTLVRYLLSDEQGNASECSFTVTVLDEESPVFNALACRPVTLFLQPTECWTLWPYPDLEPQDNCGIASVVYHPAPGYRFPIGQTQVEAVITDFSGNTASCEFTLEVIENIPDQVTMVCNHSINLSLGPDCRAEVGADMLLEGSQYRCYDQYCITLRDAQQQVIGSSTLGTAVLTADHVGTVVTAEICSCQDTPVNCCTVTIQVGAFSLPLVDCPEDMTLECNQDYSPDFTGRPVLLNCVPTAQIDYFDTFDNGLTCGFPRATLQRNWIVSNAFGDKVQCTQQILFKPFDLEMIEFPSDLTLNSSLSCEAVAEDPGLLHPDLTGMPTLMGQSVFGAHLCEFFISYSDEIFQDVNCPGAYQVLRQWSIRNECLPIEPGLNPLRKIQTLHVVDQKGPEFISQLPDITLSTSGFQCTGSLSLGSLDELLVDACSGVKEATVVVSGCQVVREQQGGFTIRNMRRGTHTVRVIARDPCWNYAEQSFEVTVVDSAPPVAVCIEETVVSLSDEGFGRLFAQSLNKGSYDNCGLVGTQVYRVASGCDDQDSLVPGDFVDFCCEDLGQWVEVVLRVWDDANGDGVPGTDGDLFAECVVRVRVQSAIPPIFLCPSDVTIACSEDWVDLALVGSPQVLEGCGEENFVYTDETFLNPCGAGRVVRTWQAAQWPQFSCVQEITLRAPRIFQPDQDVQWPQDGVVSCLDSLPQNGPQWDVELCESLGISKKEQIFKNVQGYCYVVERTWTLIDFCQYDPGDPHSPGRYERVQILFVDDDTAPVIGDCAHKVVGLEGGDCTLGILSLENWAQDESCGIGEPLQWVYRFDRGANGVFETSGQFAGEQGTVVLQEVPEGEHRMLWEVMDACGNVSQCVQTLEVRDTEPPSPLCFDALVATPMEGGQLVLEARYFDAGSFDNCTPEEQLRFSFSGNTGMPLRTFTCDDIPNGLAEILDLEIWVWDERDNRSFCRVQILLQDQGDYCEDLLDSIQSVVLEGSIRTEFGAALPAVDLVLDSDLPSYPRVQQTSGAGSYQFQDLPSPGIYTLSAAREGDYREGVSTLDIILLQRYLLGLYVFNSPYRAWAADVNRDGFLNAWDVVELRELVLLKREAFANSPSWSFLDASKAWGESDKERDLARGIPQLVKSAVNPPLQNWTAVKMGDINGNASGEFVEERSQENLAS